MTAETINTRETITSVEFKKHREKELKEKWSEKRMHRQLIRETTEKVDKKKRGRSIAVCCTGTGNQDKLYKLPHR